MYVDLLKIRYYCETCLYACNLSGISMYLSEFCKFVSDRYLQVPVLVM